MYQFLFLSMVVCRTNEHATQNAGMTHQQAVHSNRSTQFCFGEHGSCLKILPSSFMLLWMLNACFLTDTWICPFRKKLRCIPLNSKYYDSPSASSCAIQIIYQFFFLKRAYQFPIFVFFISITRKKQKSKRWYFTQKFVQNCKTRRKIQNETSNWYDAFFKAKYTKISDYSRKKIFVAKV